MAWLLVLVLKVMFQPCLSVLFTVEAEQNAYRSEFGEDVVMGCRFHPLPSEHHFGLKVTWHRVELSNSIREVYRMDMGKDQPASQDPDFKGRVRLLTEDLKTGWAKIQVSRLRLNDSGTYRCFVQTSEGADYKEINLSVTAPYKTVTKRVERAAEGDEVLLTCQSQGFPESSVTWEAGHHQNLRPNTTSVVMPDQLRNITSQIHVSSTVKNNYTCVFTNGGYSETFHIPDDIPVPRAKNQALIILLSTAGILLVIAAILMCQRRKGCNSLSLRNPQVSCHWCSNSAASCLQIKENEEENTIFYEDCKEEELGPILKKHYSGLGTQSGQHWHNVFVEDLPHRLQKRGRPVNLQALVPDVGGTVFLEGPSGSGKTTIARILASTWTEGPTETGTNALDLRMVHLFLYIDCSSVKGDLFQEISHQLFLGEKTPKELRTVLATSRNSLLLLDEYKEGNHLFDESLRNFLPGSVCRVLIMSCPGHCPTLKKSIGSGELLILPMQTVKY